MSISLLFIHLFLESYVLLKNATLQNKLKKSVFIGIKIHFLLQDIALLITFKSFLRIY